MIGIDAEYIAFTGLAEVPLDIADPIDAIGRNPTERRASRKGALDHLDRKLRLGRKADVVRTDVAFRRGGSSVQPFGK